MPWFDSMRPRMLRVLHGNVLQINFGEQSTGVSFLVMVMIVVVVLISTTFVMMVSGHSDRKWSSSEA